MGGSVLPVTGGVAEDDEKAGINFSLMAHFAPLRPTLSKMMKYYYINSYLCSMHKG